MDKTPTMTDCALISFVLATLAGIVVGALVGFTFGCLVSYIVGFFMFVTLTKTFTKE